MDKDLIRHKVLHQLKQLNREERSKIESQLLNKLTNMNEWSKAKSIAITMSMGAEWKTQPIIEKAWAEGKRVAIPKSIHDTKELHYYIITSFTQVETGYYGIEEPDPNQASRVFKDDFDLVIVPGVAFMKNGYRIGFGGGYYDRFLSDYRGPTVSLVDDLQLVERFPVEAYDVPVDKLVMPKQIITTQKYR